MNPGCFVLESLQNKPCKYCWFPKTVERLAWKSGFPVSLNLSVRGQICEPAATCVIFCTIVHRPPPPRTAEEAKVGPSLHTGTDGEEARVKEQARDVHEDKERNNRKRKACEDTAMLKQAFSCVVNVTPLFHVLLIQAVKYFAA